MSMKVKDLKVCHPDFDGNLHTQYDLLYSGGKDFLKQVALFLTKRTKEPTKIYYERVQRAFYIGYVGPIIDYFISALFALNANINRKEKTTDKFYDSFLKNVDKKKTELNKFFRNVFTKVLIHRQSFILVDLPRLEGDIKPTSRKQEDELGLADAYLVHFTKNNLVDWQYDDIGNFNWVKLYCCERFKPSFNAGEVKRHYWYIYDKYQYHIYSFDEDIENYQSSEIAVADLIAEGVHSTPGQVPLVTIEVPEGLWIMNKVASPQIDLFNLDNALAWQQYQSYFAMPVIKLNENKKFQQKVGEAYFIQLETGESFEWTEPEGKMMEAGLNRRAMLKDEIYRIVHQLSLSVQQTRSQTRQSGNSKKEDRYATEIVLLAFGDIIRDSIQSTLELVSLARKDEIEWDISGFNTFDASSLTEKLAQVLQLTAINIHSETFRREVEKHVADIYLEDANQETKDKIKAELDEYDFSTVILDPMDMFGSGGQEGEAPGASKPEQREEMPNGVNREMKKK